MKFSIAVLLVTVAAFSAFAEKKTVYSQEFDQKYSGAGAYKEKGYVGDLVFSAQDGRTKLGTIGIKTTEDSGLGTGMSIYIPAIPLDLKKSYVCRIFVKKQEKISGGSIKLTIRPRDEGKKWLWKAKPFTKIIKIAKLKDGEWNEFKFEFMPRPDDAEWEKGKFFAVLYTVANAKGQTIWFDDFEVVENDIPAQPSHGNVKN